MTDFATTDDIIAALAACGTVGVNQDLYKASITTVSGFDYSGWTCAGNPAAGAAPTTWATPTNATTGALNRKHTNGLSTQTLRILAAQLRPSVGNQPYIFRDRLGHMGGLSGTSTSAQTVNGSLTTPADDGRCSADGSDVEWWLEWYTATGSTAVNATVAVTYSNDSTGNIVVAIPASCPAFRRYRITPASGNLYIKAITSVTLSATTGTAGNFGVTATNRIFAFSVAASNSEWAADWALLGMPVIGRNCCLECSTYAIGTSFGSIVGNIRAGAA